MMERETFADPRIAMPAHPFVALRIDLSDDQPDAELVASRYALRAVPTTLVLSSGGQEAARLEGAASVEDVLAALGAAEAIDAR
jgi:thiol:disulfide interchange protein